MGPARSRLLSIALTLACTEPSSGLALADIVDQKVRAMTVEELKRNYLECSQHALCGELSDGAIATCSVVYEELKLRAFGGDLGKLLAWSRSPRDSQRSLGQRAESCTGNPPDSKVRRRT